MPAAVLPQHNLAPANVTHWRPPVLVASNPRIYVADGLFSARECAELVARAKGNGMARTLVMGADGRLKSEQGFRQSLGTAFGGAGRDGAQGDPVIQMWRERMANAALLPVAHADTLVVAQYEARAADKYELHFDSSLAVGRVATVLVFLSDVEHGGEIMFPWAETTARDEPLRGVSGRGRPIEQLEGVKQEPPITPMCADADDAALKIAPRAGRAVVFFTHAPDLRRYGYRAMHAGCPPLHEDKWIAQLFIRWHAVDAPNTLEQVMTLLGEAWQMPLLQ
jgi:hypothetical protein